MRQENRPGIGRKRALSSNGETIYVHLPGHGFTAEARQMDGQRRLCALFDWYTHADPEEPVAITRPRRHSALFGNRPPTVVKIRIGPACIVAQLVANGRCASLCRLRVRCCDCRQCEDEDQPDRARVAHLRAGEEEAAGSRQVRPCGALELWE